MVKKKTNNKKAYKDFATYVRKKFSQIIIILLDRGVNDSYVELIFTNWIKVIHQTKERKHFKKRKKSMEASESRVRNKVY